MINASNPFDEGPDEAAARDQVFAEYGMDPASLGVKPVAAMGKEAPMLQGYQPPPEDAARINAEDRERILRTQQFVQHAVEELPKR